jgi:hypothetical protein
MNALLYRSLALCAIAGIPLASMWVDRSLAAEPMIELEVYAAGVRDLSKILELDHELEAIPGLRYKVDRNHDLVYMELEEPAMSVREIRSLFRKLALEPRFIGTIPPELRAKPETQLLSL